MRNFDYLKDKPDFATLYQFCNSAELNQLSDPNKSALSSRQALEFLVKSIYLIQGLEIPERANLFELVDGETFKAFVGDDKLMMALHYIRKAGNNAAHTANVTKKESFFCLLNLHTFVGAVLTELEIIDTYPAFDKELLNSKPEIHIAPPTSAEPSIETTAKYEGKIDKKDTLIIKNPVYFTEAETRKFYIDQQLREAGWEVLDTENDIVPSKAGIEIRVEGMPNNKEEGFCDYVLYSRNGNPLAVVEAKRTSVSPIKGKHQATLYADCLEKKYGIRPVIYYTNGYELNIIDGLGYPNRRLMGFHTISELELLIQRKNRHDISDFKVNEDIAGRHYQKSAVTAVCEHFNKKHRKALLVMATGTGKTRVSISMVELLMRNNWIKNVLFLADRTALVRQAKKNFVKQLPHVSVCVLSENDSEKDMNARIMFSTYQTMINYIDSDTKEFSVGRFDLIIIDEAHRSIFGKYTSIFDYFDSLLVGLTATPRSEVDRSTYEMFEMEQGVPNFDYELEEAVADGFLVPYSGIIRHSQHIKVGIKYNDLKKEEQEQLEKVWAYEAARKALDDGTDYKRDIRGEEMFSYIFNQDTIDKVLQDLMTNGLKVQSGERIGKTIIFAYNHAHAEEIVNRFKTLYPIYGAEYCVLIDNYVTYAHDLIERLEIRDKDPQIAVSVDMLDTGIDVPDILNLVFFKIIRSKIKFLQMIGRGTRLSEGIFGEEQDKKEFYIFDYCENFEYFDKNPNGKDAKSTESLTEKIFNIRADLAFQLQSLKFQEDDFAREYHTQTKTELREQIATLNSQRIDVRKNLLYVDKYKLESVWQYISQLDVLELKNHISFLLTPIQEDETAKRFDLLVLIIELSLLDEGTNSKKTKQKIVTISEVLADKTTIPQVKEKLPIIKEVLTHNFWENLSLSSLERIRVELRDLMKFLVGEKGATFSVDIEDEITDGGIAAGIPIVTSYKQRVFNYLAENINSPAIQKILKIEKLERSDILELENILWKELGTKDDYEKYTENIFKGGNVAVFIRSIVGIDREIAVKKFSQFISDNTLNSQQQEYVKTIINYVCENGDITREVIANDSPFDGFDWLNVFGNNVNVIPKYVDELHGVVAG